MYVYTLKITSVSRTYKYNGLYPVCVPFSTVCTHLSHQEYKLHNDKEQNNLNMAEKGFWKNIQVNQSLFIIINVQ